MRLTCLCCSSCVKKEESEITKLEASSICICGDASNFRSENEATESLDLIYALFAIKAEEFAT